MADITLEVTIPDAKVAEAKLDYEMRFNDGVVMTGPEIKADMESRLRAFLKRELSAGCQQRSIISYDPY